MTQKIEHDFEDNEIFVKTKKYEDKEKTVNLFNAIRSRNLRLISQSIHNGADIHAVFSKDKAEIPAIGYIFTHGTLSSEGKRNAVDLDKENNIIIKMMAMLINEGLNPLDKSPLSFLDYEDRETLTGEYLIKKSLEFIEKNIELLGQDADDKGNKWLMYAINQEKEEMLSDFIKNSPIGENNLPWAFAVDESQQSMFIKALDTKNDNIINLFMSSINSSNVNSVIDNEDFSLLDEVLTSIDNIPSGSQPKYFKAVNDLLEKGAEIKKNQYYGSIAQKIVLENKTNKSPNKILKNSF